MEVPSSIGIATRRVIVPEFTSVAVNDGMGVIATDLMARDLAPGRIQALFARIGSHASGHVLERNRYSLTGEELRRALVEGGGGVVQRYGFDPSVVDRMENGARIDLPGDPGRCIDRYVPPMLLNERLTASEMGLNFGGNHFLELQVVDQVLDPVAASHWGLHPGQVVVMYHLGPGPFSGTLLHHFSRRSKIDSARVPAFFLSKLWFHYLQRAGDSSLAAKWRTHFRQNGLTAIPEDSPEGIAFRAALAMAMNFGYAYRLATVRAVIDGLRETVSPKVQANLLFDVSHNGITHEVLGGEERWVARHNACRLVPGSPTIVAGAWDVPSYLGVGVSDSGGRLHSYDHGAGHLIEEARDAGRMAPTRDTVTRIRMTRGRDAQVTGSRCVTVLDPGPLDQLMNRLAQDGLMRAAVRLRPIGNLKN
jgi:tRNA-splicing ligase RtcB